MNPRPLQWAGAAVLLIVAALAGTRLYHHQHPAPLAHGIATSAGIASPPNPSDLAQLSDPAHGLPVMTIPARLPPFSLQDTAGKLTPIASFAGKSLIINFWATWCAPCRSEIPLLKTLQSEWAARGITVVGIAVDHREPVLDFIKRFQIGYPILIGDQDALDAAAALGVTTPVFPFSVFTDRHGDVVALYVGELHPRQAELILAQVEQLNLGRTALQDARHAIDAGLRALPPRI